jgi:hypothetical protein
MAYVESFGDVVRLTTAAFYANGQVQEMNIHYRCVIAGGGDSRPSLAGFADAAASARFLPVMDVSTTYFGTKISVVKSATVYPAPVTTAVAAPGLVTDKVAPTQCRGLISLRTSLIGRKFRGRIYPFTPAITMIASASHWSPTYTTALSGYGSDMLTPIVVGGTTWQPAIVGYTHKPTVVVRVTNVETFGVSDGIATQRRAGILGRVNSQPW